MLLFYPTLAYYKRILLFTLLLFGLSFHSSAQDNLSASIGENDAFITVQWNLDASCFTDDSDQVYEDGVFLQLKANGVVIHTETIIQEVAVAVENSFRHETGPDANYTYQLSLYEIGAGASLCATPISTTGSTTSFSPPNITNVTTNSVEQVILDWTSDSKLASRYIIYRDGEVIANVDIEENSTYRYIDTYKFNDTTSIVNGESYDYCIETYSDITNQTYSPVCIEGRTFDINFQATDDAFENKVELTWRSGISSYWDKIQLYRNGELIEAINNMSITSYIDSSPVPGKKSTYSFELIKNGVALVGDSDLGSVPKNGRISGQVLTLDNLFPVIGAKILLTGVAGDTMVRDSVLTDFAGFFSLDKVYYDQAATFTLTASLGENSFENNPKQVTLLKLKPVTDGIIFLQDEDYETDENGTIAASDLVLTTVAAQDKVDISWTYTPISGETTFFNLYRGSTLIAALNDADGAVTSFSDLNGEPNQPVIYRLVVYRINSYQQVVQVPMQGSTIFPQVSEPNNFIVQADEFNGYATLMWDSHTSNNFAGFFIYRNGQRIASLDTDATEFTDNYAEPESTVTYAVSAYRIVNDINKESLLQQSSVVTFPTLPAAENATAIAQANADKVEISWDVPTSLTTDYNYSGFAVYRKESGEMDKTLIATKYKNFAPSGTRLTVTDYTGKPNQAYTYEICTFLATPDTTYHANEVMTSATFPKVTPATNLYVDLHLSRITLNWMSPTSNNLDGLTVYRNGTDVLAIVNQKTNSFSDEMRERGVSYDYSVKAYRKVDGQIYYSTPVGIENVNTLVSSGLPIIPVKFTSTDDLPNVVKLCWEYPEYALSIFELRRDGNVIDTLPTTARAYYDYDATTVKSRYEIRAIYNGSESAYISSFGKKSCANRLSGRVYSSAKKIGVANVRVTASTTNFFEYVLTDASGYYEFTNLPNGNLDISVEGNNANWQTSTIMKTVNCDRQEYSLDFINDYEIPTFETNEVASPNIFATGNSDIMDVTISWSPTNKNYNGFELKRGTKYLGEVAQGEEFKWVDKDAAPGHVYTYTVRAFQDSEDGRKYSTNKGIGAFFPTLQPVEHLSVFSYPEKNAVLLQWAHRQDVELSYLVERNGVTIGTLDNPERLEFVDETGLPGQLYTYTLTAYYQNKTGLFASDEQSVTMTYPDVIKPLSITASPLQEDIDLETCGYSSTRNNFMNQVEIVWDYETNAATSFEIYRTPAGQATELIGKKTGDQLSFIDKAPMYEMTCEYEVIAIVEKAGQEYTSRGIKTSINTPNIGAPNRNIIKDNTNGIIKIEFSYPYGDADVIKVYRTETIYHLESLIKTVYLSEERPTTTYEVIDKNGTPGKTYYYHIVAETERNVTDPSSLLYDCSFVYPNVPTPLNVQASDNNQSYVEVTWDYPTDAKVDYFLVESGTLSLDDEFNKIATYTVDASERSYRGIFNENTIRESIAYKVVAVRGTNHGGADNHYLSNENIDKGGIQNISQSNQILLTSGTNNSTFGSKSVSIDGNHVVLGIPGTNASRVVPYAFDGDSWSHMPVELVSVDPNFGYAVDLDYPYFTVGSIYGGEDKLEIFQLEEANIGLIARKLVADHLYGHSVAISGNKVLVGGPFFYDGDVQRVGKLWGYEIENSNIENPIHRLLPNSFGESNEENGNFSYDVAIDGSQVIVGQPFDDQMDKAGKVYFFDFDNKSDYVVLSASDGSNGNELGKVVDIQGDYAIASSFTGAYIYKKNSNGVWGEQSKLVVEEGGGAYEPVAIYGDIAVGIHGTLADIYKRENDNWVLLKSYHGVVSGTVNSVDLSNDFLVVGGSNETKIIDLLSIPQNVQASDGSFTNKTIITWNYDPILDIEGFKLYRNGIEIASLGSSTRVYNDTEGESGIKYVYEVEPYVGDRTQRASDEGYRLPNGRIEGEVKTLIGQSPIEGVNVTASAIINGVLYEYNSTTGAGGQFIFDNVYYDSDGANYTVQVAYENHEFQPAIIETSLNSNQPNVGGVLFFDKTAYVVKGIVRHESMDCGIEGLEVQAISITSGTALSSTVKTDANGTYAIAINPTLNGGLDEIKIELSNTQDVGEGINTSTNYYQFDALNDADADISDNSYVFSGATLDNIEPITTVDFIEKTQFEVALKLANTCGQLISSNKFDVRIRTSDGCLDFIKTLNANGEGTVQLPPIDNIIIQVVDVDVSSISNLLVLNYLKNRPYHLNLKTFHDENGETANGIGPNVNLTYHKPPSITISSFDRYMCPTALNGVAIVQQQQTYTNTIVVTENFEGNNCNVSEGYVVVTNPGALKTKDTLYYNTLLGSFDNYRFIADRPNLVFPHVWVIKIDYFSESGDFLGTLQQPIIVEGEAAVPGNDVVVIPEEVPSPMFILRDPPGDASSSFISAGQTIEKEFTYEWAQGLSANYKTTLDLNVIGVGLGTTIEISGSENASIGNTYSTSINFEESYSTSNSSGNIGEDADIVVGAGIAYQYGIVEEIKVEEGCSSQINRYRKLGISPNNVKTTFVQTIADIKNTIKIISTSLDELNAIPESDRESKHDVNVNRLQTSKKNWETLLEYHSKKTVPLNYICDDELSSKFMDEILSDLDFRYSSGGSGFGDIGDEGASIRPIIEHEINQWKNAFCEFKQFKENETEELFLDDEMITAYNTFINAIRILSDPILVLNDTRVDDWYYDEGLSNPTEGNLLNEDYENHALANLFGKPAENITFGGGTDITKNINVGYSHAHSFSFELAAGLAVEVTNEVENDVELEVSSVFGGVITGLTDNSFSNSFTLGGSIKYHSDAQTSVTQTTSVGYTLSDDDTGDQHSVTILQGIENSHTPYFDLVGGRSSCPPEAETIQRDRPVLDIVEGLGVVKEAARYNISSEGTATFNLKITNNSVFGETRSVVVYLDNQTNVNGAIVKLAGQFLGEATFFDLAPNQELVLPVTIERGLVAYEHDGLQLKVRPYCTDGTTTWANEDSSPVAFTVHFQNPCSPVSIITPDNNWVINGENDNLVIGLKDYQTDNEIFQELKLQYRRIDTGDDWDDLPGRHVMIDLGNDPLADPCEPVPYPVSKECLANYNNEFFGPDETPTFFMVWDFPDDFTTYPDGDYEIRAVAACGTAGVTYSNVVGGRIDRSNIRLFGQPEPADGLWIPGDEISTDFNKNINCSLFDDAIFADTSFFLYHKVSGSGDVDLNTLDRIPANVVCRNNELIFETIDEMSYFDGDSLIAVLANVTDLSGNKSDTIRWEFKVITSKLYWGEEEITVELYQGEELNISVPLHSTETEGTVDHVQLSRTGLSSNWLSFSPSGTFSVQPTGRSIVFTVEGNEIGDFEETITLQEGGLTTPLTINIKATVRSKAPDWNVQTENYSESMIMVTNYIFEDDPNKTSTDSLDMVSAWIDGEIRGVGRIEKAGMFHVAYLVISGNPEDYGNPLEFRVWKATEGVDYDAFPTEELIYDGGTSIGSTANPEILSIDRLTGKATYLPMNQGWTYFSINRDDANSDMSLDNILSSLRKVSPADEILTQDKFAEYVEGQGWLTAGNYTLEDMDVHESYRLYLENGPDTLRITGKDALYENIDIKAGWDWIGYPRQEIALINNVLNFLSTPDSGDQIYTIPQSGSVEIANFDGISWSGNLNQMKPRFGYKLKTVDPNLLVFPTNSGIESPSSAALRSPIVADPEDKNTWHLTDYDLEYVTTLIAEITVNNEKSTDVNDQLAAFMGNELRGLAHVEYIASLDKYLAVMAIGAVAPGEELQMFFYDDSIDEILMIDEQLLTLQDAGYGKFTDPQELTAAIFDVEVIKNDILCETDQTGRVEVVVTNAIGNVDYLWNTGNTTSYMENLEEGTYTVSIRDFRNIPVEIEIELFNLNIDIPAPELEQSVMSSCQGSTLIARANNASYPNGDIVWFDENYQTIHTGTDLTISNLQNDRTIYVASSVNTCPSDLNTLNVFMQPWSDASFEVDDRTPHADVQPVTFTPLVQDPSVEYSWSFGDGTSSTEMIPQHIYSSEGSFTVVLTTTTTNGCGYTIFNSDYIITDGSQIICEVSIDTDGDDWMNDCDNCPLVSNVNQTDNDGDLIGAACDCDDNNPNDIFRHLSESLETGVFRSNYFITSDAVVKETQDVEFRAGREITLEPGFEVPLNAEFLAMIEPCENPSFQEETITENRDTDNTSNEMSESTIPGEDAIKVKPNPFSGQTTIYYELAETSFVRLSIHSLAGEKLETLVLNEEQKAGVHSFPFYGHQLPVGMYYVVLRVGDDVKTQKMVITK